MFSALLRFFWIGCCAVAMLLQTLVLLDKPLDGQWPLCGFVFCATLFGYHFTRTEPWQRLLAYFAGIGAICCLIGLPRFVILQLPVPAIIWVLYYFAGPRSLRRLPWLKPVSIAFVWAWVTVWLPLDTVQWPETGLVFLGRAAFIFALALSYDLGDIHYDRLLKFPTLVQHLGEQKTFKWIDGALMAAGLVCILNYLCKIYGLWAMCALMLSLLYSAWWLRFIRSRSIALRWQKFWIDALMIIQFIWVLTGKMLIGF
jgi:4-hydroxybenzoate polyprenyltransferase